MPTLAQRISARALRAFWLARRAIGGFTLKGRFAEVYALNEWEDDESRSGPGSRRDSGSVRDALDVLEKCASEYSIRSVNDIPCGDFNWMWMFLKRHSEIAYRGFDIVPALIKANRVKAPDYAFEVLDIVAAPPPRADLIICKDLLNHLRYRDVRATLANLKASGSTYLLATNNFGETNQELQRNETGMSRLLDITASPLLYPPPIWKSHYFGIWRLADLP